jgi:hypothetical protein
LDAPAQFLIDTRVDYAASFTSAMAIPLSPATAYSR